MIAKRLLVSAVTAVGLSFALVSPVAAATPTGSSDSTVKHTAVKGTAVKDTAVKGTAVTERSRTIQSSQQDATPAAWPPGCSDSVCFWSENAFRGHTWNWNTDNGYRDLPPFVHDHVGSFVANADACFINWDPLEKRTALRGDWRSSYLQDFGGRMDGVAPGRC
jgi:hypothetical protein